MFSVEQRTEDELNSNSPEIASVEIARDRATIKMDGLRFRPGAGERMQWRTCP